MDSASAMREIFLDIETPRGPDDVAGGWANIRAFGLAVGVTWDRDAGFREWYEGQARDLIAELGTFDRIVTFNGNRFDLEVLSAYGPTKPLLGRSFDVLAELKRRLGFRVSLQSLAQATLGRSKTSSGEEAIRFWRSGDPALRQKVVEYCKQDVALLRDCVEYGRREGYVRIPSQGRTTAVYVGWK